MNYTTLPQALEIQPGDKVALVARSRCKLQLGDIPGSLEDVDKALEADPYYIKGIASFLQFESERIIKT